jgi:fluoroquinolone resistance protein
MGTIMNVSEGKAFTEENYYQQTFTRLELTDETVSSITFEECTFESCSFISTRLTGVRFAGCKFSDCVLSAVIPMNSRFDGVTFKNCKTIGVDWTKAQMFREITLKDCQLNYSNFRFMKIPKFKMTGCEVIDADFTEADLSGGDFKNSNFEKTRFMKTNLTGADFKGAKNYTIDPRANTLKKTRFSYPEVLTLLNSLDIIIE